jgi:hypothetical protein
MPWEKFSDDCPGCRPVLLDLETGYPLAEDHPAMQTVISVWNKTTLEQREAFHAMMCQNSRKPEHMAMVDEFYQEVQKLFKEANRTLQ